MNAHTPGPWIARGADVYAHRPHVTGGYNEEPILSLARPPEEVSANARLIAAAPELLEALQGMLRYADSVFKPDWVREQVTAVARAAIEKVEATR